MPVAFEIESHQIDVIQIVESGFLTMLGLPVRQGGTDNVPPQNSLTATVHFAGEWKGAVLLQCGQPEALAIAKLLMGEEQCDVDEDVRDSLGELANMIAGNLKSVLPPGVALSIPSVVAGTDYALHICGGNVFKTASFSSDSGSFWVTLVHVIEKKRELGDRPLRQLPADRINRRGRS